MDLSKFLHRFVKVVTRICFCYELKVLSKSSFRTIFPNGELCPKLLRFVFKTKFVPKHWFFVANGAVHDRRSF